MSQQDGETPDPLGPALDRRTAVELNDLLLRVFFQAWQAGILRHEGPFSGATLFNGAVILYGVK